MEQQFAELEVKMPKSKKFIKLLREVKEQYLGKKVPEKYRKKYGKIYDKDEVKSIAYSIAKKLGWRT